MEPVGSEMKMETKNEYRVRPVTRYVVTHYHEYTHADGICSSGVSCIGEFDNEEQANAVKTSLELGCVQVKPNGWIVYMDSLGEPATQVYYCSDKLEAIEFQKKKQEETGNTWRLAKRYV